MCMYFMYVTFNHVPLVQITNCALHVHVSCMDVHGHNVYMHMYRYCFSLYTCTIYCIEVR